MEPAFAHCAGMTSAPEPFVLGPAWLREDGKLVIAARSHGALMNCTCRNRDDKGAVTVELAVGSLFGIPFGAVHTASYLDRPGGTVTGHAEPMWPRRTS
ncbi:hypothetical protein GCM10018963_65460 [Saccharothrix longispora]